MRRTPLLIALIIAVMLVWINTQIEAQTLELSSQDGLELTASAIVRQATQSGPTVQPIPTVTQPDPKARADLQIHYRNQLLAASGFTHPVFEEIVDDILKTETQNAVWVADITLQTAKIEFANHKWIFLVVAQNPSSIIGDYLYSFQLTDNIPILVHPLSDIDGYSLRLGTGRLVIWNTQTKQFDDKAAPIWSNREAEFSDWNNNRLPDLVITQGDTGSCCPPRLRLIELKPDGSISDISAPDVDVVPFAFVDEHYNGAWQMIGLNRKAGTYNPEYYRWFGWDGTRYVDNSDQHVDFYMPTINAFKQARILQNACYDPRDLALENVLYAYAALHRLAEGWPEIEPLLKWDTCTIDELNAFGDRIKAIQAAVTAHRFE